MIELKKYADAHGLIVCPVRYKHGKTGTKVSRLGYDLVRPSDMAIIAGFEPVSYVLTKWIVMDAHEGYTGRTSAKRITAKFLQNFDPTAKSYYRSTSTTKL